jgi:trehalose 6-phosphate synthase
VVVVSNRVALPRDLKPGGLALAMRLALRENGGVWFGWSGKIGPEDATPHIERERDVTFATLDLSAEEYQEYYNGFANRTLWPLFHFRSSLVEFKRRDWHSYVAVNQRFADRLVELIEPDDLVWIHDYHLIPLASLLRAHGVRARLGFFLHTPFPPLDLLRMLPVHRELFEAFAAYDLVGFHTKDYLRAFNDYIADEVGAETNESGVTSVQGGRRSFRTGVFPIGIDVDRVARQAAKAAAGASCRHLVKSLAGRKLVIGVDRLDYSKGLPERFRAFGRFLDESPEHHRHVTFLQIAPISRTDVAEYGVLRAELERIAGAINGQHAEADWTALRYVNRSYTQTTLAGFFRVARIGLVTPLRDGMNLVAKEYVAAQDPADPGVLVLSRFAGAARELDGAILVNPHDSEAMADALRAALAMPLAERQARWHAMMDVLRRNDIHQWRHAFLGALRA